MSLVRLEPPAAFPVSLEMMKNHLRVNHDHEDELIKQYIAAVTSEVEGEIGRALVAQRWELRLDAFVPVIELPLPPCQSVESVRFLDSAGVEQTLPADHYRLSGLGASCRTEIHRAPGQRWPVTQAVKEAVRIAFVAGYPPGSGSPTDPAGNVPDAVKLAIMEVTATRFQWREAISAVGVSRLPESARNALSDYRVWSF